MRCAARQAVAAEIAWLRQHFAPDHLWIVDDVFGLKPGWVEEFAALVAGQGAPLPFRCLMRADQVTADVARALAASGCKMLWMGAESGSQKVLDAMEKGLRVDDIRVASRLLKSAGIEVGFFLQFGYPGETWDDIEATLAAHARARARGHRRVRVVSAARHALLRARAAGTRTEAELVRLERSLDDVQGDVCAGGVSAASTASCITNFAPASPRTRCRGCWETRGGSRPRHLRRAASWIYNRAALAVTRRRVLNLRGEPS